MDTEMIGVKGEKLAQNFLKRRGYQILETNFKCKWGEADIIATKDGEISFVEVKTRGQNFFGSPADAVNLTKRKHIYKVAEFYILKNNMRDIPISLDVIEVYLLKKNEPRIFHLRNAIIENPYQIRKRKRYAY